MCMFVYGGVCVYVCTHVCIISNMPYIFFSSTVSTFYLYIYWILIIFDKLWDIRILYSIFIFIFYIIFYTVVMNKLVIYNTITWMNFSTMVSSWGGNKSQKNMCSKIPFILSLKTCKIKEYIVQSYKQSKTKEQQGMISTEFRISVISDGVKNVMEMEKDIQET